MQGGIDRANAQLARYESVKKFVVLTDDFAVEGGELTPSLKVRRRVVMEKYAREIDRMYAAGEQAAATN